MALLPNASQIPAQRVGINERGRQGNTERDAAPPPPIYVAREWYRFFDTIHTYLPTPTVFTPVFTPVTNVTALTAGSSFSNQMGTVIALTGTFTLDPTGAGDTVFRMTPPVLDGLTLSTAAGTFVTTASGVTAVGSVIASGATLEFRLNAPTGAAATYAYNVNYRIA
jgi:hypothetical protein